MLKYFQIQDMEVTKHHVFVDWYWCGNSACSDLYGVVWVTECSTMTVP
ncbi:MAG: hypothetical protein KUG82_13800 [Pseudomonadales bacterium]|nr:hypothetical protein [Pseudomonadales bacterium]